VEPTNSQQLKGRTEEQEEEEVSKEEDDVVSSNEVYLGKNYKFID
jgi:hypothetical protein